MKFCIILLFTLLILKTFSINVNPQIDETEKQEKKELEIDNQPKGDCELKGFTTNFEVVSNNIAVPWGQSLIPLSWFESGIFISDYESKSVYYDFKNTITGTLLEGKLWGFISNNTQYVLSNFNGVEMCIKSPLQVNMLARTTESKKVKSIMVGSLNCDVYENNHSVFNFTNEKTIVDPTNCALVSSTVENQLLYKGKAIYNYYNFKTEVDYTLLQVPSICFTEQK